MAAAIQANFTASISDFPSDSATAKAPLKISPAVVVSRRIVFEKSAFQNDFSE